MGDPLISGDAPGAVVLEHTFDYTHDTDKNEAL
jgi:hypothetical protein